MNGALQTPNKAKFYSPGRKEREAVTDSLLSLQQQRPQCRRNLGTNSQFLQVTGNLLTKTLPPAILPSATLLENVLGRNSHVVGQPAGQPGSFPGRCDGDRSAWLPHEPSESPPAAASHLLLLSPEISPWPGSARTKKCTV